MNWQAIGIGAAVGIVIGLVWNLALTALMAADPYAYSWVRWFGYAVSIVADIAVGATAGWFAARNGAGHGALADIVAIVGGFAVGIVMALARKQGLDYLTSGQYWTSWLPMVLPGIAIAALAGWS